MSHTPGPWNVGKAAGLKGIADRLIYAESEHSFDLAIVRNGGNDEETGANAALIASAPDMLAALEGIADLLNGRKGNSEIGELIRAEQFVIKSAIAKARGQS